MPTTTAMTTNAMLRLRCLAASALRISSIFARRSLSDCFVLLATSVPGPFAGTTVTADSTGAAWEDGGMSVATEGRVRTWSPGRPLDLGATLGPLRRGSGDPTFRYDSAARRGGGLWCTTRTPDGAATLRLTVRAAEGEVVGTAWGDGAAWVLDGLPALLGGHDD